MPDEQTSRIPPKKVGNHLGKCLPTGDLRLALNLPFSEDCVGK